ncbi:MAG: DNA polymerase III subunit gamma and tau [Actinomycetaceae bacterium]|nr:DNA polymerase III subunit gamma and tau [Actinomycetaceae bacterium]
MSTALYRRYRPDTFADVIGQEHVTHPLIASLDSGKPNHAYLFSGPRGCGKTTSARIMARCLNCAQGPTGTPCGVCESCVDLATGAQGSIDVVEIDAASHNGVDDARNLRERATFVPVRDRYKVYILDEVHMLSTAASNALLKLVEEPPAHAVFIFATTEPEKVISTIRSRTHHYPFRLVPPGVLRDYCAKLCAQENIQVDDNVLSLVVRAGAGSVRDSLSVLDQLMAGAVEGHVTYSRAATLLGYTDSALLDGFVDSLVGSDGAGLYRVIDRVIEAGNDPRRFVEDLLQRFRDLVVLCFAGDGAEGILVHLPADEIARIKVQAQAMGHHRASLAADMTNTGLTDMSGATSPRLLLELLAARLLLAVSTRGPAALAAGTVEPGPAAAPKTPQTVPAAVQQVPVATPSPPVEPVPQAQAPQQERPQPAPSGTSTEAAPSAGAGGLAGAAPSAGQQWASLAQEGTTGTTTTQETQGTTVPTAAQTPQTPTSQESAHEGSGATGVDVDLWEKLRNRWEDILQRLGGFDKIVVSRGQLGRLQGGFVELNYASVGELKGFETREGLLARLEAAISTTMGQPLKVRAMELSSPEQSASAVAQVQAPVPVTSNPEVFQGTPVQAPESAAPTASEPPNASNVTSLYGRMMPEQEPPSIPESVRHELRAVSLPQEGLPSQPGSSSQPAVIASIGLPKSVPTAQPNTDQDSGHARPERSGVAVVIDVLGGKVIEETRHLPGQGMK